MPDTIMMPVVSCLMLDNRLVEKTEMNGGIKEGEGKRIRA